MSKKRQFFFKKKNKKQKKKGLGWVEIQLHLRKHTHVCTNIHIFAHQDS
jgi:hypothetical protein